MKEIIYVPTSLRDAAQKIRLALRKDLNDMTLREFIQVWHSFAYLFPGLHPDGFDAPDSGWSESFYPLAAEAWRRNEAGELTDQQMYPSEAQWAGLADRMNALTPLEKSRRNAQLRAIEDTFWEALS